MAKYTVLDTETNKTITFDWLEDNAPSDTDFEQIFSEAKSFKPFLNPEGPERDRVAGYVPRAVRVDLVLDAVAAESLLERLQAHAGLAGRCVC